MTHSETVTRRQLAALTEGLQHLLFAPVGAYVHGSAASGRLQPQSDIDVVAVTGQPLADVDRKALTRLLLEHSGRYPRAGNAARPIELTVVIQGEVRPLRYPPRC